MFLVFGLRMVFFSSMGTLHDALSPDGVNTVQTNFVGLISVDETRPTVIFFFLFLVVSQRPS